MNTLFALIVLCSLAVGIGALLALFSRRLRRRAAITFAVALAAFVTSLSLFTPHKPSDVSRNAINGAASSQKPAVQLVDASTSVSAPTSPGVAKVCLTDDDVHLGPHDRVAIPATTVFEDDGPTAGRLEDPSSWAYEVKEGSFFHAAIETLAPIELTASSRCAETKVQMLTSGTLWSATSQKATEHHVFAMTDVLDYPIPSKQPPIEVGKLIDDISVKAMLISDVNQTREQPDTSTDSDTKAAQCLAGARKLAPYVGAGIGRQTSMIVSLGGVAAQEASYGCASGSKGVPDLFVGWQDQARPPAPTMALIMKAGEYLTGATQKELQREMAACVSEALKPDAGELANREFRGVKIECQAFARDGGGGSVTVYRRFGADPVRGEPSVADMNAVDRASSAIKDADEKSAADARKFAEWWQDPTIPKEVKTFAMMAARVVTLAERCPTANPHDDKIAKWAADVGVTTEDIQPDGRYGP